jgi:hypothetical protein
MASAASRRLLKELPTDDEMSVIITDLRSHGDAPTALLGAAYLENALKEILKGKFVTLNKEDENRMFDGAANGVLGTFSAKIRLAYAINILGPIAYHDLMLINDIRNVFAHSLHKVSFSNEHVASDCRKLQFHDHFFEVTTGLASILAFGSRPPIELFAETVFSLYISMLNLLLQTYAQGKLPSHRLDDFRSSSESP